MSIASDFERDGFVVLDTGLSEETLDAARLAEGPLQPDQYHWNKAGRRVFEGWKTSQAVRKVVYAPRVCEALVELYGGTCLPFQTINFDKPTQQRLHQDRIHFDSWGIGGGCVGVWVALEDVGPENGSLAYVPKSHLLGGLGWQELGFEMQEVGKQYEAYTRYEDEMEKRARFFGGKKPLVAKKGQAFIWGLHLLHGGWKADDPMRSRWSMVSHYAIPESGRLWAPMFSDPAQGIVKWKKTGWFTREGEVRSL